MSSLSKIGEKFKLILISIGLLYIFIENSFAKEIKQQELLVSNNGNFLFYNSPVAVKINGHTFIAFVTREGKVTVNELSVDKVINSFFVHDYSLNINKKIGFADDHAAPAIINDTLSNKLLLATAYHGTDLFIYEYKDSLKKFYNIKTLKGNYTYPRLVKYKSEILLFVRKLLRDNNKIFGNLVVLSSKDNFTKERLVLNAYPNSTVYASRPFVDNDAVFLSYSMHDYKKGYLIGWKVLKFDPHNGKTLSQYDLSKFLPDHNYGNRPTSIAVSNNKLLVGTAYFNKIEYFRKERFFNRRNKILILEIDLRNKNKIKIIHKNTVLSPYYATDIYID
ncbi:MAG: BNR-4 repeat-containing protein, partial [Flavobacteriaceae bacterium]|nr:BNR-4 repeat-containing protein [Flavobacteriaceae bacterium]